MIEMILAAAVLVAVGFVAGYAVRSQISARRRRRQRIEQGF